MSKSYIVREREDGTRYFDENTPAGQIVPEEVGNGLKVADNKVVIDETVVVDIADAQTITGAKTFTSSPQVPTADAGDNSTKVASTAFVAGAIADADGNVVHKTGNELVNGTKTFTALNRTQSIYPIYGLSVNTLERGDTEHTGSGAVMVFGNTVGGTNTRLASFDGGLDANRQESWAGVTAFNNEVGSISGASIFVRNPYDGAPYAICPTPANNAVGNEIATASYVSMPISLGNDVVMDSSLFKRANAYYTIGSLAANPPGNAPINNVGDYHVFCRSYSSQYRILELYSPRFAPGTFYVGRFWRDVWSGWKEITGRTHLGEVTFYVDPVNGVNSTDAYIGLSQEKPYKTLQYCLAELNKRYFFVGPVTVKLANGVYNERIAPYDINGFTWHDIVIEGESKEGVIFTTPENMRGFEGYIRSGKAYVIKNLTIKLSENSSADCMVYIERGHYRFNNVELDASLSRKENQSIISVARPSAYVEFNGPVDIKTSDTAKGVVLDANWGTIDLRNSDVSINGSGSVFANARWNGKIASVGNVSGTFVGKKFSAVMHGIIMTNGAGENKFPGTIAGTVDASSVYA